MRSNQRPATRDAAGGRGDKRFGVLLRIRYANALNRWVPLGAAPYSEWVGDLTDTEPGLLSSRGKRLVQPVAVDNPSLPGAHNP
jgi:hypothetical protein